LKVLHIIDSGGLYGAEVMILNLIEQQERTGIKATIASIGAKSIEEKPLETEALKRGLRVEKFRMLPGPNFAGASKILRFAFRECFDILHSHGYKGNILFGFIPKSIRKLPLVTTLHGWTSSNGFTKKKLYEWIDALSLRYIDVVIPVSEYMLNNPLLRNCKNINFHVVNNGIPSMEDQIDQIGMKADQFRECREKSIIEFCKNKFIVGSIGRLSEEKGHIYLIKALKILTGLGIDAQVVIIGEGSERTCLEKMISKLGVTDRVMLAGYQKDAKRFISFFDVFVLPSLSEGFPITLLEAMQARIPIVATDVGGIPEILDNSRAGLIAQPGNPDELVKNISRLYYNGNLARQLLKVAYERVTTAYDSKNMASRYFNIYHSLLYK